MARALISGRVTLHREPVEFPQEVDIPDGRHWWPDVSDSMEQTWTAFRLATQRSAGARRALRCPLGQAGDLLWIQEAWRIEHRRRGAGQLRWRAELPKEALIGAGSWRKAFQQPRGYTRLIVQIQDVAVRRAQDVAAEDLRRMGHPDATSAKAHWDDRFPPALSWESDPWCWHIGLRIVWRRFAACSTLAVDAYGRQAQLDLRLVPDESPETP